MNRVVYLHKGDEFYREDNGSVYILQGKHFSDFEMLVSDEYDEEKQEYVNFTRVYLTRRELCHLANANFLNEDELDGDDNV